MNCATHSEIPAVAFCRSCGKALCNECRREWQGVIYCESCAATQQATPRPQAPPLAPGGRPASGPAPGEPSPGLAFVLGFIPGVGAIYNGQYAKGVLHVVVLGLLISILSSGASGELQPLIGMFTGVWFFYMAFEAYHTAKKRLAGEPVDEFSGLLRAGRQAGNFPLGPLVLIGLGVMFLLNTLGYWSLERIERFWPVLLILAGVYMLYGRLAARAAAQDSLPPPNLGHAGAAGPPDDTGRRE
ncbi:MAG TPA: B-box zinc finger protein [Bryobacterales bacterium]|nr:B-box zinc finger protein [Bryobacterales bacterium]